MTPYFSIVIPALNEERALPKLLKDLQKQQLKNFEVIVVDGMSTDKTVQKAESFADSLRLRTIISDKKNLSHQRNLGAQAAEGKYLFFLDCDMRINSRVLSKLKKHIDNCHYLMYLPFHLPDNSVQQDEVMIRFISFFTELSHLTDKPFTYGPSMIFLRSFFYDLGGFDEKVFVYEDHEIVQRARKRGVIAKMVPDIHIKFSMRRYDKEGRFNLLGKYLRASTHLITQGKVDKKLFEYDMGGQATYLLEKENKKKINEMLSRYFKKVKKFLKE